MNLPDCHRYSDNDLPDLDNAVLTPVVRGTPGSQSKYWLRQVAGVTLAEVVHDFQHDASFKII